MTKHILFVGGGSIGHLAPAVAVWRALRAFAPETQASFVCSERGEDTRFLSVEGLSYTTTDAPRLSFSFPWKFFQAYRHARAILDTLQPRALFSKGGYVSVPLCLAARRRGIPIVLHESDAVSGYANRLVSRWAAHICCGFPDQPITKNQKPKTTHTGNPIREEIMRGSREQGLRITGFTGERPILLVLGGSQGAQALNEAVHEHFDALTELCDIAHLTGRGKRAARADSPRYWSREFVVEELPHLYAIADIALSRAGAGCIAELAANAIPALFVPLRGVAHDHQEQNARRVAEAGGCLLLEQAELEQGLVPSVADLVHNLQKRRQMAQALRQFAREGAARQIAEIIAKLLA